MPHLLIVDKAGILRGRIDLPEDGVAELERLAARRGWKLTLAPGRRPAAARRRRRTTVTA